MRSTRVLALLPLALLLSLAGAPLARLMAEGAGTLSPAFLFDPYYRWRLLWSFTQALATCALALLFGLPIAWALARFDFPGRRWLMRLMMLPFVMPTLVAAMGVLALFGPEGVTGVMGQDTPWLLLYGNLFYNLPLLVRSAQEGFARLPASRIMAARTLGASPWRVFWRIELPGALPWVCSALCLVFLYCFSGFGLALILGGQRYATVEVEIYTLVAYELNLGDASALALTVLAITGLAALGYAWLERILARPLRGMALPRSAPTGWRQYALLALAMGLTAMLALAPLAAIAWRALWAGAAWQALADPEVWGALANTARFTALALAGACVFGLAHAFAMRRSVLLGTLAFLPYALSPICVAFGLLLLYPGLSASLVLLIGAYTLLAYPFIARGLAASLDAVPAHLPQAARTLGASPWRLTWRLLLPLAAPALRRGMAFAAATALGEFAVTLFLSRPEWMTLTTLIYQRLGRPGAMNQDSALVLSCLLMLLAMLAFVLIEWQREEARDAGGR
ncbi:MAG: iron ABC transporter permease [Paludibacterium sp.]|uniref:ABC transporter permease n=1 Tax=Paludibacterium sp. TaxID=1917523 RepID=UPI0025CE2341|nr:iron ABC transporter permease [Paludibacterium sp.]MBV8048503.1 iron ABC transporter permease [Paludibacterium sp.]MBV8647363.1 iron ABC transporter permease [Paludibacterium sp.]